MNNEVNSLGYGLKLFRMDKIDNVTKLSLIEKAFNKSRICS